MVSHAGEEGRTYQEVKQLGADLQRIAAEATGRHSTADIAVLHDWHAWWAGAQDGRMSTQVDYPDVLKAWHRALWQAHLATDFAHPEHDLTPYPVVVVPQLYALTDAAIDNLLAYVQQGGTLVCGFLTGVADEYDRVRAGGMDARLRDLFGIRTLHEWWPLDAGETVTCEGFRGSLWSEELEAEGTADETVPYKGGELDGLPAVCAGAGPGTSPRSPSRRRCATCWPVSRPARVSARCSTASPRTSRRYAGASCCSCSTTAASR
jgi:beta-galactosidase